MTTEVSGANNGDCMMVSWYNGNGVRVEWCDGHDGYDGEMVGVKV